MKICSVIVLISNKTQPDRNASIYKLKVNQQTYIAEKKKKRILRTNKHSIQNF